MNLTAEQAAVVRAALDAGQPYAALVVPGDWPKMCPLADPTECNGEHCDCPLRPPADWVALTKCQTCDGTTHVDHPLVHGADVAAICPDCRDGRRLVEFTEPCCAGNYHDETCHRVGEATVPLTTATVEVVDGDDGTFLFQLTFVTPS